MLPTSARRSAAVLFALALGLVGCGDDDPVDDAGATQDATQDAAQDSPSEGSGDEVASALEASGSATLRIQGDATELDDIVCLTESEGLSITGDNDRYSIVLEGSEKDSWEVRVENARDGTVWSLPDDHGDVVESRGATYMLEADLESATKEGTANIELEVSCD